MRVDNNVDMAKAGRKLYSAIDMFGIASADKLEADAKANARWEDRTGNAKNSIQGDYERKSGFALITLSGNMYYSVFLELAMEKKYAILYPTIKANVSDIVNGFQKVVS